MSIARHHADWLSLVPVSGPFLSLPVLMDAFSAGLEPHDPEQSRLLRQEYGKWQESFEKRNADPAPHQHWIRFVLTNTLDLDDRALVEGQAIPQTLQVEVPEHHELLRPSIVVVDPNTTKPRLLVHAYPRSQELTSYVANSRWKASPDTRMTELLHGTGVRLGLVTNGEHWMLVDAPKGETTGYASWHAYLWLEEPITLRAFRSLLSAGRFFNVGADETLEALLTKSASNQQDVTDQLGYQVRRAVEVLIHSLDRADQDFGRELLADVTPEQLYESALTVMMRLVFLFCAEERELIPSKPFPVYEQNYSVSTISKQLRDLAYQHGEELLERRYDTWPRLLAAFRAVYGGLQHDDVHIPAYGGSLFNPDRFPFLEGRKPLTSWRDSDANPLPVNNRTVLHLLESLQLLRIKVPGGGPAEPRRLSFRALDIEQIGHVYEGLLDHTAKRAAEPFLGLAGTRAKEPELPLAELEKLLAKGEADLVKFLKDETGKTVNALKKALHAEIDDQLAIRFRTACQGDDALWQRVQPQAGLVRLDNFDYPVVIPKGSVFVTAGTDRRATGTHYTPRSLTEPIVQYTLEPLVYVGPAEGKPKTEWKLKSAKELLELKICDMACGSGAFLVQAARYLAERLMEAWDEAKLAYPNVPGITPEGTPSTGKTNESLIPDEPAERKTYAMRIIAQRCLYGVDKNPLAVEMAKLSLWLLTLAKDKPFEFLDHSIRCGDSLVGIHSIEQLQHFSLHPESLKSTRFKGIIKEEVVAAIEDRLKLEEIEAVSVEDVRRQEELLKQSDLQLKPLRHAADLLVSASFWRTSAGDREEWTRHFSVVANELIDKRAIAELETVAAKERRGQPMFHWPLEFPEVIVKRGGFDAFVGNPPFMGGTFLTGILGGPYREFLVAAVADAKRGNADLCAYFFCRAYQLLGKEGFLGLVATNTISQGDTREVGLDQLTFNDCVIVKAMASTKWPGTATLFVANVWISKGIWEGERFLENVRVSYITPYLTLGSEITGNPYRLAQNGGKSSKGVCVNGMGFILSSGEADELIEQDPRSRQIVHPFVNGEDLNTRPDQNSDRWIINFYDMPLSEAKQFDLCFQIVQERVKPARMALNDTLSNRRLKEKWWRFERTRRDLHENIVDVAHVLATARVSPTRTFARLPTGVTFSEQVVVITDAGLFCTLLSSIHWAWVDQYVSTLGSITVRYSTSDCFETFPFPNDDTSSSMASIADTYDSLRRMVMHKNSEGLTATYNRFHDPDDTSDDIQKLRDLHIEMDQAVAAAYGWNDLDLGHGFHETKQGVRFTINESARREVLQRLLKLNHERYAEEVKQGLHGKKGTAKKAAFKKKAASKSAQEEATLFDGEVDE